MNREELIAKYSDATPILDHGHVRLIDVFGDDSSIVQAARVSYGKGTKTVSKDRGLIRYLIRKLHTSPLEMCEIKLHIKCPLFVANQWLRHRTANVNSVSARYSEMPNEMYLPNPSKVQSQAKNNKQGRGRKLSPDLVSQVRERIEKHNDGAYDDYQNLINSGVARELSRTVLPVGMYTEFYWKNDLHNLMHFLRLRMDSHAQYEIRVYANHIAKIVQDWVPLAWEAFVDYRLEAQSFSRMEMEVIRELISKSDHAKEILKDKKSRKALLDKHNTGTIRERIEFLRKIDAL